MRPNPFCLPLQGFEGTPLKTEPIWPCSRRGLPSCPVARNTGELLPHLFTLSPVTGWFPFLWHFPSPGLPEDSALRSALPCGARTFLCKGLDLYSGCVYCFGSL